MRLMQRSRPLFDQLNLFPFVMAGLSKEGSGWGVHPVPHGVPCTWWKVGGCCGCIQLLCSWEKGFTILFQHVEQKAFRALLLIFSQMYGQTHLQMGRTRTSMDPSCCGMMSAVVVLLTKFITIQIPQYPLWLHQGGATPFRWGCCDGV